MGQIPTHTEAKGRRKHESDPSKEGKLFSHTARDQSAQPVELAQVGWTRRSQVVVGSKGLSWASTYLWPLQSLMPSPSWANSQKWLFPFLASISPVPGGMLHSPLLSGPPPSLPSSFLLVFVVAVAPGQGGGRPSAVSARSRSLRGENALNFSPKALRLFWWFLSKLCPLVEGQFLGSFCSNLAEEK